MDLNTQVSSADGLRIPSTTRLGYVHLTVANLDHQITFYTRVIGFTLHWRDGAEAALGTESEVLLRLTENPAARRVQHTTGMYHFAILFPSRKELARAIARLFVMRYPNAPTDHGVSKTTYLDDPEGNTIELYIRSLEDASFEIVDGQFSVRYADGRIGTGRDPLDVEALFQALDEGERLDLPLPEGTRIGHMHLYASGLQPSMNFYRDVLGFQEGPLFSSMRMGEVALDEQQPHVIAFNTWKGTGIPPAPVDALGLRYFTIVLPTSDDMQKVVDRVQAAGLPTEQTEAGLLVRDPSHISMILTTQMPPRRQ
ncbi:MAG: VOC family protein [Anaerolineae bacterium]|nr:VOC family protein [Anaerolineae bacterium]